MSSNNNSAHTPHWNNLPASPISEYLAVNDGIVAIAKISKKGYNKK